MQPMKTVFRPMTEREWQAAKLAALCAFVREVANQDPAQPTGQRQSNKERAEDLCEQWGIIA